MKTRIRRGRQEERKGVNENTKRGRVKKRRKGTKDRMGKSKIEEERDEKDNVGRVERDE